MGKFSFSIETHNFGSHDVLIFLRKFIGQRAEIYDGDIQLVKKLYKCEQTASSTTTRLQPTANPLNTITSLKSETTNTSTGSIFQTAGKPMSLP